MFFWMKQSSMANEGNNGKNASRLYQGKHGTITGRNKFSWNAIQDESVIIRCNPSEGMSSTHNIYSITTVSKSTHTILRLLRIKAVNVNKCQCWWNYIYLIFPHLSFCSHSWAPAFPVSIHCSFYNCSWCIYNIYKPLVRRWRRELLNGPLNSPVLCLHIWHSSLLWVSIDLSLGWLQASFLSWTCCCLPESTILSNLPANFQQ